MIPAAVSIVKPCYMCAQLALHSHIVAAIVLAECGVPEGHPLNNRMRPQNAFANVSWKRCIVHEARRRTKQQKKYTLQLDLHILHRLTTFSQGLGRNIKSGLRLTTCTFGTRCSNARSEILTLVRSLLLIRLSLVQLHQFHARSFCRRVRLLYGITISIDSRGSPVDFPVLPARRDVTEDHAKLTRYLSREADETGVGTRSHVAIYQVTVGTFNFNLTNLNKF